MPELKMTCPSVPEQYELLDDDGTQLAYLRLRFGRFTVEVPGPMDQLVYERVFIGDRYKGVFDTAAEREEQLAHALLAVAIHLDRPELKDVAIPYLEFTSDPKYLTN